MKRYLIILACFLAGSSTTFAGIWRVNNNAGVARDYATIQEAVDIAVKGDTIHIEGSVTTYDETVTVDKKLSIIGPGFYLTDNTNTQHIKLTAKVTNINFDDKSAGSVLAGIEQFSASNKIAIFDDSIKIVNCKLFVVEIQNTKEMRDIDVRKCWMDGGKITTSGTSEVTNLNITNNFFNNATGAIVLGDNVKALISNNTFYNQFIVTSKHTGTTVSNNVFFKVGATATLTVYDANRCNRNLYNVANLGGMATNNNFNILDVTAVANWFSCTGGVTTVDKYFTARSGTNSPIYDAAPSGQQLGMFGGLAPYELSGMTNIPSVYEIVMPSEVSSDGFDVTVKVKAH